MGKRLRVLVLVLGVSAVGLFLGSGLARDGKKPDVVQEAPPAYDLPGRVRVEVLNGGGVFGVAWDATIALRDQGFDVVNYGNAGTYSADSSVVLDRVGDLETASKVARALEIPLVRSEPDSTLYVEVTVRLGPDWTGNPLPEEAVSEPSPWWDFTRFFRGEDEAEPQDPSRR